MRSRHTCRTLITNNSIKHMVTRYWYEYAQKSENLAQRMSERYVHGRTYTGTISPSGRISVGIVPAPKELKADKEYEESLPEWNPYVQCHWDAFEGLIREEKTGYVEPPALGLSADQNHHSTQKRRCGLKGITANGRAKIYEGVRLLEGRYGRRLGFYTLTCPYNDGSLIYEFNRNIGEIQRRWFQHLRRFYSSYRETFSYVSVVEVQTKRYMETGQWCLHIHYVAPCYYSGTSKFVLSATELRYLWMRTVAEVVGIESDTSSSVDSQIIKRSASGYLAKYVSKGSGCSDFVGAICPSQFPGQWWSMSQNVKRAIRRCVTQIPEPLAEWYFGGGGKPEDGFLALNYRKEVFIPWKGLELHVGMSGQLCQEGLSVLRNNSVYALSLLFI